MPDPLKGLRGQHGDKGVGMLSTGFGARQGCGCATQLDFVDILGSWRGRQVPACQVLLKAAGGGGGVGVVWVGSTVCSAGVVSTVLQSHPGKDIVIWMQQEQN